MQPRGDRPVIISFQLEHLLGWGLTIGFCVIPVFLWLQIHPLATIQGFPAIMLALGRITGLVGTVMYALNLVFSTRLRLLEPLFGGLNRVYIAHHVLGGLALVFLAFHPLLLALRFVTSSLQQAALLLLPNGLFPISALFSTGHDLHAVILEQWAIFFGFLAFWGMVGLLLVTFFIKLPYRIWLLTHKFLGAAFFLGGLHILFVTSDTSAHAGIKWYMLAWTAIGLAAFAYRTLLAKIFVRRFTYKVMKVDVAGGNVTQILMAPIGNTMPYKPGQFVFIRFLGSQQQGISAEWHPFSISSSPKEQHLRLSVKGLGDYTNILSRLAPGVTAEIEGAYGKFTYTNVNNHNQIWIGGGIGITPFISMAKDLADKDHHVDLYYTVKTTSEVVDWQALYDMAVQKNGQFRVIPYIGDQQQEHLNADYIEKTSGGLKGKDIFICGPPGMMQSLRKQFKDKGIPGTSIHSEEFGMS